MSEVPLCRHSGNQNGEYADARASRITGTPASGNPVPPPYTYSDI